MTVREQPPRLGGALSRLSSSSRFCWAPCQRSNRPSTLRTKSLDDTQFPAPARQTKRQRPGHPAMAVRQRRRAVHEPGRNFSGQHHQRFFCFQRDLAGAHARKVPRRIGQRLQYLRQETFRPQAARKPPKTLFNRTEETSESKLLRGFEAP
jgi:hypothetical protein